MSYSNKDTCYRNKQLYYSFTMRTIHPDAPYHDKIRKNHENVQIILS